jgi:hypothetical protein
MPAVRKVVSESAPDDYRFSAIVLGIVQSEPFLRRSATGQDAAGQGTVAQLEKIP